MGIAALCAAQTVLVCLSGRGDKDLEIVMREDVIR